MESSEKSKLLDGKGVNIEVKREHSTTTVKVKASSTVKDAKPSTTYHKERIKIGKSSSTSIPPSSSSSRSVTLTRVCPVVKEEVQTASCSSSSLSSSSPGSSCATSAAAAASSTADRSFTAADSNSNIPTKSFVGCKVCGDKASGYHYGVTSCEGCKGFFRRSIQKQIEYRCLRDSNCQVIRLNRNRCQFCRFKKCLSVGMSRDSVRYGRVPKRSKGRDDEGRVTQSEPDQSATKEGVELNQNALYDIILAVTQAHRANCPYTDDKTRVLIKKPAVFSGPHSDVELSEDTVDSLEQQKLTMWEHFAEYVTPSVQRIVEFAKKTPGFFELVQDDQLVLIKTGFFEMWLVQVSRMIEPHENTLTFCDGSYVSRHQLELIFDQDFTSSLFSFGETLNNLRLGDTELALFSAMVLLTPDRPGVRDSKFIQQHQDKMVEALKFQINCSQQVEVQLLTSVINKLPELRSLGMKHNEHLKWFRMHSQRVKLPPLFIEIFDIPKSDADKL